MKEKFNKNRGQGDSIERRLKKESTWNLASGMGITLEQAHGLLVYLITHLHNVAVANAESNSEVAWACRTYIKSTFKLYDIPAGKVHTFARFGISHPSPELPRPDFLDAALERSKNGQMVVPVGFSDILSVRQHGLN